MNLRTKALDCLYLNWALPRASAPALPEPLRYEAHEWRGEEYVFASALLFRVAGLHARLLPFLRLSYPQMNCRVYVLDGEGMPSMYLQRMLVPFWIVPVCRVLARQPASAARFAYGSGPESDAWSWSVRRRRGLEVAGRLASPVPGAGPSLGSWERTVDHFRHRRRGYVSWRGRLRSIHASHRSVEVWPLAVEVGRADLMAMCFGEVDSEAWQTPHSAWLCPEIPFIFELSELRAPALPRGRVPAAEGC